MLPRRMTFCFLFAFVFTACALPIMTVNKVDQQEWLQSVEDGKTTRDEILLKLGEPSAQFEGGRILTYRMEVSEDERFGKKLVKVKGDSEFTLILPFDGKNTLKKHNLLQTGYRK